MLVNGEEYRKQIQPPTAKQLLKATAKQRKAINNVDTVLGKVVETDGSKFMAYSAFVKDIQEVNMAYAKVKAIHSDARHVVGAFRIPNTDFHTHQDFYDNDEHSVGERLLQLLSDAGIFNRALFCRTV